MKLKTNSKKIKPGDVFIALRGQKRDGHNYIEEAIKNGARKVIVEEGVYNVETTYVSNTKKYLEEYLKEHYSNKISNLKLIGVTGTNGKTTTSYLIYQMLNKLKVSCAYIGTIGFYLKDQIEELDNTTPEILELYNLLKRCSEEKIEYVVMEASSQALDLDRLFGLKFDYTIFTNLSIEHLDYHLTMKNYLKSKQKLFKMLKEEGIGIVNNDDQYNKEMKLHPYILTYGFKKSDYQLINYQIDQSKTTFSFSYNKKKYLVESTIRGSYNIYNLLSMLIVLNKIGYSLEKLVLKVPFLKAPPGRMDIVNYKDNLIIVDYAHTPDAVFNILNTIKEFAKGKIYSIIGCGGDRDKSKRNKMTFYATTLSDLVLLTSDNPRTESIDDIIKDMLVDIIKTNYKVITSRQEAIKYGIKLLKNNDILAILGKGHESEQIIGCKKMYHNDKEYVLKLCK